MLLSKLIATLPMPDGAKDIEITGLTADSRAVKPGMIFAAIKGVAANGQDYIAQAIKQGAAAILSDIGLGDLGVPYIAVDNPRETYAYIASRLYAGQPETMVAMTGTNGKSSTVEFLRQLWANASLDAACFGTLGIVSNAGTTPLTHTTPDAVALQRTLADLAEQGVTHCGMEASSHGLVQYRLDGVRLSAVGFTNLTQDHFDYHSDMEDYFNAKARLFTQLAPKDGSAVINVDSPYGRRIADLCTERGMDVLSVGWRGAGIRIAEITPHSASQMVELHIHGKRHDVELPLAGEFQVLNAVSAAGLALVTGISEANVLDGLTKLTGVNGRMERIGLTKDGAPIFVDFAHTPDGLDKLLRGVRPHTMGRIIIVFGCGGDRDPDKRAKMGAIAEHLGDVVIVTDDNPRTENADAIRKAVMEGCPQATEIGDREKAIHYGVSLLEKGDCLVIAGKGHESGQIIGDKVIPFKDADVARKALEALK